MANIIERSLSDENSTVVVFKDDVAVMLKQSDIVNAFIENRKLVVCTENDRYMSKLTMRELENLLDNDYFVRISRFEIVNLRKVSSFDLGVTGTIRITFVNGGETWVARRYMRSISDSIKAMNKGGRDL